MKSKLLIFLILLPILSNCSQNASGPEGSWGSEETNTILQAQVTLDTSNVDICNTTTTGAKADITVETVNEGLPENTLYLEKYTLEFLPQTPGAPSVTGGTFNESRVLPVSGLAVAFMDKGKKEEYVSALSAANPSDPFPLYTVKYTFSGKDKYAEGFGVAAQSAFKIGKYGTCAGQSPSPLQINPSAISLTGIANPDGDSSDDIVFYLSGGSAPYTVYSDNTSVIPAPGSIGNTMSFSIDPETVALQTKIALTVSDSKGQTVAVSITVNPSGIQNALSVSPGSVSLIGFSNPDTNDSDNIKFFIKGGTPPYTVYSDNAAITAPGLLGAGVSSFEIDPDSVSSETAVKLTVLDSIGQSAIANVVLK